MQHTTKSTPNKTTLADEFLESVREEASENIEVLLEELGIEDFYSTANDVRACCPVHNGDNDTAFSYNKKTGYWKCYTGMCHEKSSSSVFGLVRAILSKNLNRDIGFADSVYWVCEVLDIETDEKTQSVDSQIYRAISQVKDALPEYEVDPTQITPIDVNLVKNKVQPSEYFKNIGFSEETLKKFMVFDCNKNHPMNKRACAPILSIDGTQVIGWTGRITVEKCRICERFHFGNVCPEENQYVRCYTKWRHHGVNSLSVLYNWHEFDPDKGYIVVCEGPKNVWWMDQHGIQNVVCLLGLTVSQYHIEKFLESGVSNIVFASDYDEAGINKYESFKEEYKTLFNIHSLFEYMNLGEDVANLEIDRINKVKNFVENL